MIVDNNYNKWNINKLPRTKGAQGTTGYTGVVTLNTGNNGGNGYSELEGHYLWGQFFNGKQDVNGDITTNGDVNFYGNLNFKGTYDPDDDLNGNLNIGNVNADNGHFKEMNADLLKSAKAYIDNLTVTGSAHFFELIIDKIRSVGGAIMLTPGDGFELWGYNLSTFNNINLWWVKTDDRNGKYNKWVVGDQALCRSFDSAQVGNSSNVNNKYWWAKVVDVDQVGKWCTKLHTYDYNPDEVMVLPTGENNEYYTNTHSYLRKSDFVESSDYVYVETAQRTHWITNEEYFALDDNIKSEYEYSQLYVHKNEDGSVLKITELQYNNTDIDEVDLLIYDEVEDDWKLLRSFSKADCKYCYSITIDKTNCSSGSVFSVTENNHTAYVFQEGDNIVMLGHQKQQTETEEEAANRQNAIYLNAGENDDSLDADLRPPFFAQYKGINNFDLKSHRLTWFSGGSNTDGVYDNEIRGNLKISTGESVEDYVGSQLVVEEDRIAMMVKSDISEAGITILDDEIVLDADKTTVTGTLQLDDDETGLVIYDNNEPIIAIQNDSVASSEIYTSAYCAPSVNETTNYIDFMSYGTISELFYTAPRTVISASTYAYGPLQIKCAQSDFSSSFYSISSVEIKIDLYKWNPDEYITTVYDGTITPSSPSTTITIPQQTFTSSYAGGVCFKVTKCKVTFANSQNFVKPQISLTGYLKYGVYLLTKIGNDGARFMTDGDNKYVEYSNNGYTMKWGDQKIEMKNIFGNGNVLYRTVEHPSGGGIGFGDIGSMLSVRIIEPQSGGTSMQDRDGFVVIKGTWSGTGYPLYTLIPPSGSNGTKGRRVFIKNMTNQTLTFKVSDNSATIINAGATAYSAVDSLTVGPHMCYFICDGEYWYFGYCG